MTDFVQPDAAFYRSVEEALMGFYRKSCADDNIVTGRLLGADARAIWDGQTAGEITTRLGEFKGISRKKAALGTMVLVRDLGVQVPDKHCIDIAVDVHVHRVFLRTGFAMEGSIDAITSSARAIHPSFPGEITTPVWVIGREYCRPQRPLCPKCPLDEWCRKDIDAARSISA